MSDTPETPENAEETMPQRAEYHGPSVSITDELKTSYLDYAMSVIVSRAIPDLRDGLKPVHRRILFAMHETGNSHDKPYRKSARPVGDVMGKYHPHGDAAIYDALVRMAQDFSMSLPLLDGQGNFGSMDGDNAAAMRYTEVRMDKPAAFLLADIDKETVDFHLGEAPGPGEQSSQPAAALSLATCCHVRRTNGHKALPLNHRLPHLPRARPSQPLVSGPLQSPQRAQRHSAEPQAPPVPRQQHHVAVRPLGRGSASQLEASRPFDIY